MINVFFVYVHCMNDWSTYVRGTVFACRLLAVWWPLLPYACVGECSRL